MLNDFIGVYMPFYNRKKKKESTAFYETTLSLIIAHIRIFKQKNIPILIIGDFNADPYRIKNNLSSNSNELDKIFFEFIQENDLTSLNFLNTQLTPYSYFKPMKEQTMYYANLDHALLADTGKIIKNIQCNILSDVGNLSDHLAIKIDLDFEKDLINLSNTYKEPELTPKLKLENIEIQNFFNHRLEYHFYHSCLGFTDCSNIKNPQEHLDSFYNSICKSFSNSTNESLIFQETFFGKSFSKNNNKKNKWFTKELKIIKDKMVELNRKITFDPSLEIKKKELKKEFRKIQRQKLYLMELKEQIKLEQVFSFKDKKKFWKKITKFKSNNTAKNDTSIPLENLFSHFQGLFKEDEISLSSEQLKIKKTVESSFENCCNPSSLPFFKLSQLNQIICELKNSYVTGYDLIFYSQIKNVNFLGFQETILEFFNQFLLLKKIPKNFNTCKLNPILKDTSKNSNDLNNIRPISISNCLAQIFEKLILINSPELYNVSKNQFGFRKKTSCNHALFVVKETILNYLNKKSGCRIASLDAEKAFDKVWRNGLFYKLLDKLNLTYWYLLKTYYDSALAVISLPNRLTSDTFKIETGVKQGGVLSSFLFNAYIDDLINECLNKQLGALYKNLNVSIIVYADDIILISPVDSQLQILLDICSDFGNKWRIKFNVNKTHVINFGPQLFNSTFYLNGFILKETNQIDYLGFSLDSNLDLNSLALKSFKKVQNSFFGISFLLPKNNPTSSPGFKSFIYKNYCLSKFTYGLEALTLNNKTKDSINTLQNNLIRQMFNLAPFCHMSKILKVLKMFNFEELYIYSKLCFIDTVKYNYLSSQILRSMYTEPEAYKSFSSDLALISKYFNIEASNIENNIGALKSCLKHNLYTNDGISDSIWLCLNNLKIKYYRVLLRELTNYG